MARVRWVRTEVMLLGVVCAGVLMWGGLIAFGWWVGKVLIP